MSQHWLRREEVKPISLYLSSEQTSTDMITTLRDNFGSSVASKHGINKFLEGDGGRRGGRGMCFMIHVSLPRLPS